jgi:hypothetical protein
MGKETEKFCMKKMPHNNVENVCVETGKWKKKPNSFA